MDIERDAIGWRQITVVCGVILIMFAATAAAILSVEMPQIGSSFEYLAAGAVVFVLVLDTVLRPRVTRLWTQVGASSAAEFRLKVWAVGLLCVLSLATCAMGVLASMRINY